MRRALPLLAFAALLASAACDRGRAGEAAMLTAGGDPDRGRAAIRHYGCGACHSIPGVRGADAHVGPPLDQLALRTYIAGSLPNTADNLIAWIRDPHRLRPDTAMQDTGVTESDARDIAAYLYTLR